MTGFFEDIVYRKYKSTFEAAHYIEGHVKCGIKHGHSYLLEVNFIGDANKWLDFQTLKEDVDSYVQKELDHHDLGNATAEEISKKIGIVLSVKGYRGNLTLWETSKFGVSRDF